MLLRARNEKMDNAHMEHGIITSGVCSPAQHMCMPWVHLDSHKIIVGKSLHTVCPPRLGQRFRVRVQGWVQGLTSGLLVVRGGLMPRGVGVHMVLADCSMPLGIDGGRGVPWRSAWQRQR